MVTNSAFGQFLEFDKKPYARRPLDTKKEQIPGDNSPTKSKLERNFFDDIIYSDNKGNIITYKSNFLERVLKIQKRDKAFQKGLYQPLRIFLEDKKHYVETFDLNFFDKVVITSNQGDNIEMDLDMVSDDDRFYWANKYRLANEDVLNPNRINIVKDAFGNLSFRNGTCWARLYISEYGEAEYLDSHKNRIRYNKKAWSTNLDAYEGDTRFFEYLINLYIGK